MTSKQKHLIDTMYDAMNCIAEDYDEVMKYDDKKANDFIKKYYVEFTYMMSELGSNWWLFV